MLIKISEAKQITNPLDVAKILQKILKAENKIDREKEHYWVVGLNTKNIIKYIELVNLGILNFVVTAPREIFRMAIYQGVAQIITAHNHPSGDVIPSKEDIQFAQKLVEAGKIIEIEVIDSLIITENDYLSFKEKGLIK
jgi:DNA repair protein RadC